MKRKATAVCFKTKTPSRYDCVSMHKSTVWKSAGKKQNNHAKKQPTSLLTIETEFFEFCWDQATIIAFEL